MSASYYNELDPYCAAWLRNLIAAGHIAAGDVDERDIRDVRPDDLRGYTQCHFFAGIGAWSYALRLAGWADDRPVWTGSCPCQPFSAAGQGLGFDDERHLWPDFYYLISECKPSVVFGEQVASKDTDPWIDLVQSNLEALGHAFGSVPFPSAGVGAPHIRDRNFWVAHANGRKRDGLAVVRGIERDGTDAGRAESIGEPESRGDVCGLADGSRERRERWQGVQTGRFDDRSDAGRVEGDDGLVGGDQAGLSRIEQPGPTNGFWRAADWLLCRDGKWRPVEPGTFPLAHEAPSRVGRLRAYGNAINAEAARCFIEAAREVISA